MAEAPALPAARLDRGGSPQAGAGGAARLVLEGVAVSHGDRCVLVVDELSLAPGEVLAVLGPNGAGKTTLLHVCGFLRPPTNGTVYLDGTAVRGAPLQARRRATLLLQAPTLLHRSVLGNVELGLRLRGMPRGERRGRALEWLGRFRIAHLAERSARTLSGGEAQRVALARALAFEPAIALLDEPFTALDQPTRETLAGTTVAELRRLGSSTIFVTHDREEALNLADRVLVLADGVVRQLGTPTEVLSRPADALVAAFIGAKAP